MTASIFSFGSLLARRQAREERGVRHWSTQELAELYRVCDRLAQAGLQVSVDTGLTDEGEPWAVFVQSTTGDVFVHIARIDGETIVVNTMTHVVYRGRDFRSITDEMLREAPLALPRHGSGDTKVVIHPRAVFTAFVAAAIFIAEMARSTGQADAGETATRTQVDSKGIFGHLLDRLVSRDPVVATSGIAASLAAAGLLSAAAHLADPSDSQTPVEFDLADLDERHRSTAQGNAERGVEQQAVVSAEDEDVAAASEETLGAPVDVLDNAAAAELPTATGGPVHIAVVAPLPVERALATAVIEDRSLAHDTIRVAHVTDAVLSEHDGSVRDDAKVQRTQNATKPVSSEAEKQPAEPAGKVTQGTVAKEGEAEAVTTGTSGDRGKLSGAIIVADLPTTPKTKDISSLLDKFGVTLERNEAPDAAAKTAGPDVTKPSGQAISESIVIYTNLSDKTPVSMVDGKNDIVIFDGKDIKVYNFNFGEDYLFVNGAFNRTDWIKDITIQNDDIVITGVHGGTLWLYDVQGLMA